jgi:hypothetical protein
MRTYVPFFAGQDEIPGRRWDVKVIIIRILFTPF